jgi:hypothetical protein
MGKLLILTCGQIALLVVNVICEDFAGLTVTRTKLLPEDASRMLKEEQRNLSDSERNNVLCTRKHTLTSNLFKVQYIEIVAFKF